LLKFEDQVSHPQKYSATWITSVTSYRTILYDLL